MWRARALENGLYLAACNRPGVDKTMDYRQATSCVYGPSGQLVFGGKNEDSQIFHVELPLDRNERLEASLRLERLSERRPSRYRECYLNLRMIRNITSFLELPKPGILDLRCIVPGEGQHPIDALQNHLSDNASEENRLYVLPPFDFSDPARGCDLSLSIEEKLSSEKKILAAVRTIENLATSVCCGDGAGIWTPPDGHKRWGESLAGPAQCCHVSFDTNRTRSKSLQDSIDFQLLLGKLKEE